MLSAATLVYQIGNSPLVEKLNLSNLMSECQSAEIQLESQDPTRIVDASVFNFNQIKKELSIQTDDETKEGEYQL